MAPEAHLLKNMCCFFLPFLEGNNHCWKCCFNKGWHGRPDELDSIQLLEACAWQAQSYGELLRSPRRCGDKPSARGLGMPGGSSVVKPLICVERPHCECYSAPSHGQEPNAMGSPTAEARGCHVGGVCSIATGRSVLGGSASHAVP